MRIFKIIFFIPAILILQTVLLPRFNFRGVSPDLILVSTIAFAVLSERKPATFFSITAAFLQDTLSAGIYFNTAAKVIVSNVVSGVKEEFVGDEYYQTAGLTVVLTPLVLLGESLVFYFLPGKDFDLLYFVFRMFAATACNLVAVPFIFPVVKVISRED